MRRTYALLYALGATPWETTALPAPLVDLVEGRRAPAPGVAVDLGCGTGTHARYLATHGWSVTGIDAISTALETARQRDPEGLVTWRRADVTRSADIDPFGRLVGLVDLILDNGCLHGIAAPERQGWAATVQRLAAPGALLLVRAAARRRRLLGPLGIGPDEVGALLGADWHREPDPATGWQRLDRAG